MPHRRTLLVGLGLLGLALVVYGPALRGTPASDDVIFFDSPYLQGIDVGNLVEILDPTGQAPLAFFNYAPVHSLLHALEIRLFGDAYLGYHVVNVLLHALSSTLLALLLLRSGLPPAGALLGALLFLLHPANVEAVAWISQLKTVSAAALAFGALLAQPRRPRLGLALFALALLAKPHAAFALPVAAALAWCQGAPGARWRALALWLLVFAAFAAVELPIFLNAGGYARPALEADSLLHARTVLAIGARYLVMATTSAGVSTFHEPPLATSLLDPWWLAGLAVLPLLGWRLVWTLLRRREEGAYWVWALVAFAPVCQVLPFLHMMGDRYLYLILPGLIGAVALAGRDALQSLRDPERRRLLGYAATAGALCLALAFGVRSNERAHVWRHEDAVSIDAALNYPDGIYAHLLRARNTARQGDAAATADSLRAANERGWKWIGFVFKHPAYATVLDDASMQALIRAMAGDLIETLRSRRRLSQMELQTVAQAHIWREEYGEAEEVLESALALGGPVDDNVRAALTSLRALRPPAPPRPGGPDLP